MGAPLWVIAATAWVLNLRFVVFSVHWRRYFGGHGRWRRMLLAYLAGDPIYARFVQRFPQPAPGGRSTSEQQGYFLGLALTNWAAWQAASLAGIFLADAIPTAWACASWACWPCRTGPAHAGRPRRALLGSRRRRGGAGDRLLAHGAERGHGHRHRLRGGPLGRPPLEHPLMPAATDFHAWLAVLALVLVTVLTRSFFLLPHGEPRLPGWLRQGLRHAPVAALLAMVVPEIFLSQGRLPRTGTMRAWPPWPWPSSTRLRGAAT